MAARRKITIAELDLNLTSLEQKVKQAEKLLNLEGFKDQAPARLKQTFEELEKSLDKLYKTKPVSGANSKEITKYQQEVTKFTDRLSTAISSLSNIKIDNTALQKNVKALQELKKEWEAAKQAADAYKEDLGSKGALNTSQLAGGVLKASGKARVANSGYRDMFEAAEKKAISAAKSGNTSDIRQAYSGIKGKLKSRLDLIDENDDEQAQAINAALQQIETRIKSLIGQAQRLKTLETESANK